MPLLHSSFGWRIIIYILAIFQINSTIIHMQHAFAYISICIINCKPIITIIYLLPTKWGHCFNKKTSQFYDILRLPNYFHWFIGHIRLSQVIIKYSYNITNTCLKPIPRASISVLDYADCPSTFLKSLNRSSGFITLMTIGLERKRRYLLSGYLLLEFHFTFC